MCGIFAAIINGDFTERAKRLQHRGPDRYCEYSDKDCFMGFSRLCIHDTSSHGDQPMQLDDMVLICNGEIYNYKQIIAEHNFEVKSDSDCEVILHLMKKYNDIYKVLNSLNGVYAFVLKVGDDFYVARDRYGVRPLFFVIHDNVHYFASEIKALEGLGNVQWFMPMTVWCSKRPLNFSHFKPYQTSYGAIKESLETAVKIRLTGDRPIGFLLSGGLDSSIIASLGQKVLGNISTFSIEYEKGSRDAPYCRLMSKHLKSDHHQVKYNFEDGINALETVIKMIESYDITTVRASIPHYLIGKYIKENTDIKIVLSGEGADEVCGGYLYLHKAPSEGLFRQECNMLLNNIYRYDALRSDRCLAAHGLEVRVPFLDHSFVHKYQDSIMFKTDYQLKPEKTILRKTFEYLLPKEVCWRTKDGFSDSNGSFVDDIKVYAEKLISDAEMVEGMKLYQNNPPLTKEALLYRRIYEKYYPGQHFVVNEMWLPKWTGVTDPSGALLMED